LKKEYKSVLLGILVVEISSVFLLGVYFGLSSGQIVTGMIIGLFVGALINLWPFVWMLYRIGFVTRGKEPEAFTAVDTNKLSRVVISQKGDEEHIISGPPEATWQ